MFAISGDPIELGLVVNLDRPEANATGAARRTEDLNPERLKVICELIPQPRPVAFLINSDLATAATTNERIEQMEAAAAALGRRLVVLDLAGQSELADVFANMAQHELIGGGWRNSLSFLEKLRAVTPGDVQRVSQKYMRNIRFVVLGNPAKIDKNVFVGQPGN